MKYLDELWMETRLLLLVAFLGAPFLTAFVLYVDHVPSTVRNLAQVDVGILALWSFLVAVGGVTSVSGQRNRVKAYARKVEELREGRGVYRVRTLRWMIRDLPGDMPVVFRDDDDPILLGGVIDRDGAPVLAFTKARDGDADDHAGPERVVDGAAA